MDYNVALDDERKYRLQLERGEVRVLRYGTPWLKNPEGSKAWIAAADRIEELENRAPRAHDLEADELQALAEPLRAQLVKAWGWPDDDQEAAVLAVKIAESLAYGLVGSGTKPEAIVRALLAKP